MQKLNGRNKAQFFSMDFVVAILLFITILISSIFIWDYSQEKIFLNEKRNNLNLLARNTASSLVETPGNPSNWSYIDTNDFNETNVLSLGLTRGNSLNNYDQINKVSASGFNFNNLLILDQEKIQRLYELDQTKHDKIKKILGLLGPNYEFEISIKKWNGYSYTTNYTIGLTPINASNIVRLDRFALLNNTWTDVMIKVWEK